MIEFIESNHKYLVNNRLTPSVSTIVDWYIPSYIDIPKTVLNRAAKYGTLGHNLVEQLIKDEIKLQEIKDIPSTLKQSLYDYVLLTRKNDLKIIQCEETIAYKNLYAGRYDLLTDNQCLIDLKFTSNLYLDKLQLQLSMYKYAYEDTFKKPIEKIGYIWLPKGKKSKFGYLEPLSIGEVMEIVSLYGKFNE